jgi:hypothetical protein
MSLSQNTFWTVRRYILEKKAEIIAEIFRFRNSGGRKQLKHQRRCQPVFITA